MFQLLKTDMLKFNENVKNQQFMKLNYVTNVSILLCIYQWAINFSFFKITKLFMYRQ
jgi:hypothetical protein